jgi:glycosyltransferase involved in cell wall biosynthesis|tara:strand:- start:2407 stop:3375 length:969 start_codon:yes stop_codon:yes gene_type:complete
MAVPSSTFSKPELQFEPKIAIVLSIYNGEKYLVEQIDSLLRQTYKNLVIVIRDDGSNDKSFAIVEKYASMHPKRFHLLALDNKNKGASSGFEFLMEYVLANKTTLGLEKAYLMFCDQDDVWFDNKVEIQMDAMLRAEDAGRNCPVLIHSDLLVVSSEKNVIAKSFVVFQGLEIKRNTFPNLIISNLITGCTTLINEALAVKALPISDKAIMHDWWLAIVAAAFGKVIFLDMPLIYYRQHENNTIGAKEFVRPPLTRLSFWRRLVSSKTNPHLNEVGIQAAQFKRSFGRELSARNNLALFLCSGMRVKVGFIQRGFYRVARRF